MNNYSEVRKIVQELYNEFLEEEKNLSAIHDSNMVRIDELEQRISNYKKNEDVDFKVFSPRNSININNDKIIELEENKKELEIECNSYSKQIKYYSEKLVKLEKVLELLNSQVSEKVYFEFNEVHEDVVDDKEKSIFDELFPQTESDKEFEKQIIEKYNLITKDKETINESGIENIDTDNEDDNVSLDSNRKLITPGTIAHIVHKAEFTEKIMSNDSVRAKIELKEIIKMLKELIK